MNSPVLETARRYLAAGLSVIPVRADGSKAPAEPKWDRFAEMIASDRELQRWFGGGRLMGIGIAGGKASGNLAVLDFETTDSYIDWRRIVPADTADALSECPVVRTPSGGFHVWVRLTECTAGTVLARRPDPEDPTKGKVLVEVRGDGHQVPRPAVPPSVTRPATCTSSWNAAGWTPNDGRRCRSTCS
ncbi:MAG: bifunctional DNA primase/polymerase [Gemmataceae bacterium]